MVGSLAVLMAWLFEVEAKRNGLVLGRGGGTQFASYSQFLKVAVGFVGNHKIKVGICCGFPRFFERGG